MGRLFKTPEEKARIYEEGERKYLDLAADYERRGMGRMARRSRASAEKCRRRVQSEEGID